MSEITLTFTSDGEVKTFYCDTVCYGAKLVCTQPFPKGWKLQVRVIRDDGQTNNY